MRSDAQKEVLRLLGEELQQAEARVRSEIETRDGIKNAIAQVQRLPVTEGEASPIDVESTEGVLSTSELVLAIITETTTEWGVPDLHAEMVRRGWRTDAAEPVAAVRASLQRLAGLGKIERANRGTYRRPMEEVRYLSTVPPRIDQEVS